MAGSAGLTVGQEGVLLEIVEEGSCFRLRVSNSGLLSTASNSGTSMRLLSVKKISCGRRLNSASEGLKEPVEV